MTGRPWYEELYDDFANYDQESYAQGTQGQVDFIERIIGYDQSKRILDVGCGTGRRALELSRRGYPVVGIDLSPSMLEQARWKARAEQLTVESVHGDARTTAFNEFLAASGSSYERHGRPSAAHFEFGAIAFK
jgi:ubiquinone/menaquinone biosynthesis C-methylase UbiE